MYKYLISSWRKRLWRWESISKRALMNESEQSFFPLPHLINDLGCREEDKSAAKINQQDAAKRRSLRALCQGCIRCVRSAIFLSLALAPWSAYLRWIARTFAKWVEKNGDRTLLPASPFALCHASKLINAESGVIDRLCSSNISAMREVPRAQL